MVSILTHHIIDERKSTRTFLKTPLEPADIQRISAYMTAPENLIGPFGHQCPFELVIEHEGDEKAKIGTYGVIANAQGYILGGCTKETTRLFDYAYLLENIVLYLTSIGIGTCWLGGRFRKQEAMSHLSMAQDEIIPAITPIGYSAENPRMKERVMRSFLKARKRKPEDQLFFYETFDQPLGDRVGEYQQALHYVRVGPSAQNKQSWRLVFNTDLSQVHFYASSGLADHPLYMCEPEYLDIGIAYNHFKAGLDECGITGKLVIQEPAIEKPEGTFYITSWFRD
jgi:Putative TM nitroreductase